MKTKFALLFLPALMALSSCCAAAQPAAEKTFLEDTTAHSEIFGDGDVVGGKLAIRNRAKNDPISTPDIGYQIRYDSGADKIAIRFVAAIKDLNVKAYWRRGVAGPGGTELRSKSFANNGQEVTNYYTSLTDGNTTITAGVEGKYADYVGFVVYSIYNIPYTANKDAYVAAYVNLVGDEDGDSSVHSNSKAYAIKVEVSDSSDYLSKNTFTFDPTINKHFLQGTINGITYDGGEYGLYEESGSTPSGDYAWYDDVPLLKTDSFGSFYYDHDRIFMFCGHSSFCDGTDYFNSSSLSGFNTPVKAGTYDIHISSDSGNENHIFASASSIESGTKYTIRLKKGTENGNKWDIDGAWFAVYMFGGTDPAEKWVKMSDKGTYYEYNDYDPNDFSGFIVVRMKGSDTSTLAWSNKDNQSRNLYIYNLAGLVSYFHLAAGDPWNENSNDYFAIS